MSIQELMEHLASKGVNLPQSEVEAELTKSRIAMSEVSGETLEALTSMLSAKSSTLAPSKGGAVSGSSAKKRKGKGAIAVPVEQIRTEQAKSQAAQHDAIASITQSLVTESDSLIKGTQELTAAIAVRNASAILAMPTEVIGQTLEVIASGSDLFRSFDWSEQFAIAAATFGEADTADAASA